jgi:hypothetical protein
MLRLRLLLLVPLSAPAAVLPGSCRPLPRRAPKADPNHPDLAAPLLPLSPLSLLLVVSPLPRSPLPLSPLPLSPLPRVASVANAPARGPPGSLGAPKPATVPCAPATKNHAASKHTAAAALASAGGKPSTIPSSPVAATAPSPVSAAVTVGGAADAAAGR